MPDIVLNPIKLLLNPYPAKTGKPVKINGKNFF